MNCPHCGEGYTDSPKCTEVPASQLARDREIRKIVAGKVDWTGVLPDDVPVEMKGVRLIFWQHCPNCGECIVELSGRGPRLNGPSGREALTVPSAASPKHRWLVYPKRPYRKPLPESVPASFRDDFEEAWIALAEVPKASAALSRRCLQRLIREKAGITKRTLFDEIEALINGGSLPGYINENLHGLRHFGNFGTHPIKSESTGEIIDVEPGEAEWQIDTLEHLFDHYFVKPALTAERRENLNKKLVDAGKPPMPELLPEEDS